MNTHTERRVSMMKEKNGNVNEATVNGATQNHQVVEYKCVDNYVCLKITHFQRY